jgi:hypothetical protein
MRMTWVSGVALCACLGAVSGWTTRARTATATVTEPRASAVWAYRAKDLATMTRDVEAIVLAKLEAIDQGRVVLSTRGEAPTAFEQDTFVVTRGVKGLVAGELFTVERVATRQADGGIFNADGGSYAQGETYLLFLNRQPETGMYYLVNDEGRYVVDKAGRLRPSVPSGPGSVKAVVGGRAVDEISQHMTSLLRRAQ